MKSVSSTLDGYEWDGEHTLTTSSAGGETYTVTYAASNDDGEQGTATRKIAVSEKPAPKEQETASPKSSPAASPSESPEASPSESPEASPSASPEASPSASPETFATAAGGASPSITSGTIVSFVAETGADHPLDSLTVAAGADKDSLTLPDTVEVMLSGVAEAYALPFADWNTPEGSDAVGTGDGPWQLFPEWDGENFPLSNELKKTLAGDDTADPVVEPDPFALPYIAVALEAEEAEEAEAAPEPVAPLSEEARAFVDEVNAIDTDAVLAAATAAVVARCMAGGDAPQQELLDAANAAETQHAIYTESIGMIRELYDYISEEEQEDERVAEALAALNALTDRIAALSAPLSEEAQALVDAVVALNSKEILTRANALRTAQDAVQAEIDANGIPTDDTVAALDEAGAAFQPDSDAIAAALELMDAVPEKEQEDPRVAAVLAVLTALSTQVDELLYGTAALTAPADYNTWFTVGNIKTLGITNDAFAQAVFDSIVDTTTGIDGGTMPAMSDHILNPYDWPPAEAAVSPTDPPRITSYDELMAYINDPAAARTPLEKTRMLLNWYSGKINASNKGITDINGISLLQNANTIDVSRNKIQDLTPLRAEKNDPPMFSGHVDFENNPVHKIPAWMGGTIHADTIGRGSKWVVVSDISTRFRFGDTSEATLKLDVENTSGTGNVWEVGDSDPLIDDPNKQDVESTVSIDTVDPNLRALTVEGKMAREKNDGGGIGLYKTAMVRDTRGGINSYVAGNIQYNSTIYTYQILTRLYSAVKDTASTEFLGGSTTGVIMPTPISVRTPAITTGSSAPALFNNIVFTEAGDYTFTVTETDSHLPGVTYATPQTVHVKVTDDGGTLTAQYVDATGAAITDGDKLTFTNAYAPTPVTLTEALLSVTKRIAGETLARAKAFTFTLALTGGDATAVTMPNPATVTTAAITSGDAAAVWFNNISFSKAGKYTFTITETPSGIAGMADAAPQYISVEVTDDGGRLRAVVQAAAADGKVTGGDGKLTFVNTYTIPRGDLVISKEVTGVNIPAGEDFYFTVSFSDGGTYAYTGSKTGTLASGDTLTLKDGETVTFTGILHGVIYTVVEAEKDDYTPTPANRTRTGAINATPGIAAFANTYVMPVVSLSVEKVWDDNSDALHVRPVLVQLQLVRTPAGGTAENVGAPFALTGTGDTWAYTFTNLPEFDLNHNRYTYSVTEVASDTLKNYAAPVYAVDPVTGRVTVTNTIETIDIPLQKNWADNDDARGVRPATVRIQLKRQAVGGGVELVGAPVTVNAGAAATDPWEHIFTGLPKFDAIGRAYTYSVEELAANNLKNYTTTYAGDNTGLTVTNTLHLIELSGKKIWAEVRTGFTRPDPLHIDLYRSDDLVNPLTGVDIPRDLTVDEQGYTFRDLLEFDENGVPYTYTVDEPTVPNNYSASVSGMDITNSFPANLTYQVTKAWDHTGAPTAQRPTELKVRILRDGVLYTGGTPNTGEVTLNAGNGWTANFIVSAAHADGAIFTFEEDLPAGYAVTYGPIVKDKLNETPPDDTHAASTITNTFIMPKVSVSGSKNWAGVPAGVARPAVTVNLLRNGTQIATQIIPVGGTGYSFADLDRYDPDGNTYTYTVEEVPVTGYDTVVAAPTVDADGNVTSNITNTYNPDPIGHIPPVRKIVTGAFAPATARFTFTMTGSAGAPMPPATADVTVVGQVATIQTVAGLVEFGEISFSRPGTYTYDIAETAGTTNGFTYDDTVYTMRVIITDHEGVLEKEVTYALNGVYGNYGGAAFTNAFVRPVGDLVISKTVTGVGAPTSDGFFFTVTFSDGGTYNGVASGSTITLRGGESRTITGIPQGVTYTVVEAAKARYTPTPADRTATGTIGETPSEAAFANAYTQPVGSFSISKTVTGTGAPTTDEFAFVVTFSDGGTYNYTGSRTGTVTSGGSLSLRGGETVTFDNIPQGVTYTVVEAEKTNYTPNPSNRTISGTVTGTASTAAFTNAYADPTRNGNLTISKRVTGDLSSRSDYFTFTITLSAPGPFTYVLGTQTGTLSSGATFRLAHGQSLIIQNIPEGTTYRVTETNARGYTVTSTGAAGTISTLNNHAAFLNTKSSVPKMGDEQINTPLLIILGVSVLGLAGCIVVASVNRRKKHRNKEQ